MSELEPAGAAARRELVNAVRSYERICGQWREEFLACCRCKKAGDEAGFREHKLRRLEIGHSLHKAVDIALRAWSAAWPEGPPDFIRVDGVVYHVRSDFNDITRIDIKDVADLTPESTPCP